MAVQVPLEAELEARSLRNMAAIRRLLHRGLVEIVEPENCATASLAAVFRYQ